MGTKPDERGSKFPSDTALVAGRAINKIAVRRMLKPRSAKTEATLDENFWMSLVAWKIVDNGESDVMRWWLIDV
jgi:hypothetical protein